MRQVWIVARNDLCTALQRVQTWLLLLVLPAVLIYVAGLGTQGFARRILAPPRLDVVDQDHTSASAAFLTELAAANDTLLICPQEGDPAGACLLEGATLSLPLAEERLSRGVSCATLVIPPGFAAALEGRATAVLTFRPGESLASPELALLAVHSVLGRMVGPAAAARSAISLAESLGVELDEGYYSARLEDARRVWGQGSPIQVATELSPRPVAEVVGAQLLENGFKLSTPSIAAMFVMMSILGMSQTLVEERMNGILRLLGMMPVSRASFLGGRILSTFALGFVQYLALLALGAALGVEFGGGSLPAILLAAAYVLAVTALGLALGTLARTPRQASGLATATLMVLCALGGAWWPLTFVPGWMQVLGHLSPVAWCLDGFNALLFQQGTWGDVLRPVAVLGGFAVVYFALGVRILRRS